MVGWFKLKPDVYHPGLRRFISVMLTARHDPICRIKVIPFWSPGDMFHHVCFVYQTEFFVKTLLLVLRRVCVCKV